jgi:hypothetical protein
MGMLPIQFLLLSYYQSTTMTVSIRVNYDANIDNLPTSEAVTSFIATNTTINHVKLFDANLAFLATNTPSISLHNFVLPTLISTKPPTLMPCVGCRGVRTDHVKTVL